MYVIIPKRLKVLRIPLVLFILLSVTPHECFRQLVTNMQGTALEDFLSLFL